MPGEQNWAYLRLLLTSGQEMTAGGEAAEVFGLLTDRAGVRPGTHKFLRIAGDAVYQGTPLVEVLVKHNIAEQVDQPAFNQAENFEKKTISADDIGYTSPSM